MLTKEPDCVTFSPREPDFAVEVVMTDLINDGCGWSANGCWARRTTLTLPGGISDLAAARRIKAAIGAQGFRVDEWSGSGWSWRSGTIGVYADVII